MRRPRDEQTLIVPARRQALAEAVSTIGTLERFGPLGADNRRRQLGRSVVLELGEADRAKLLFASATRAESNGVSIGEALSQQMCITVSKRMLGTPEANSKARVQGVLKWGGDGHQTEARFEWLEGVCVRPVGSSISLSAELVPELDGAAPTVAVEVGAFVGYGAPARPAVLCDYAVTTDEAPSATFEVPPFARAFSLWANANVGIEWLDGTTVLYAGLGAAAQPLATRGQSLSVPPATHLRLTPSALGALILTWELAI